MRKVSIVGVFLILNVSILFLVLNPWATKWQGQGILILVLEGAFLLLIGIPVLLHQMIRKKKTFKQSLSDSLEAVLNFLSGFGP